VGTGHRARVCLSLSLLSLPSSFSCSFPHFYSLSSHHHPTHITISLASYASYFVSCRPSFLSDVADSQLYTTAISARPSSQLVALCDLNSERMKHHNDLLKELGKPEAKTYHAVSFHMLCVDNKLMIRMISPKCWKKRNWMCLLLLPLMLPTTSTLFRLYIKVSRY
jgi:hypothetical protein